MIVDTTMPENVHPITETRMEQRRVLEPLRAFLNNLLGSRSFDQVGRISGIGSVRAMRILSGRVAAPSYVDLTEMIVAAGLSPNQAAELCGLYHTQTGVREEDSTLVLQLDDLDPRLVDVIRSLTGTDLSEGTREGLMRHMWSLVQSEVKTDRAMRQGTRRHPMRRTKQ